MNLEEVKNYAALKEATPHSENYCCPKCGTKSPDEEYNIDGQKYPQYYNQYTSFYGDLSWDEVHCCPKCRTLYYFKDGD